MQRPGRNERRRRGANERLRALEFDLDSLEEERRLAYVGITRAKKLAIIGHAGSRRIHNQWQNSLPSRFLAELPKEHIDRRDHAGFAPARASQSGFGASSWGGNAAGWVGNGRSFAQRKAQTIDVEAEILPTSSGIYPPGSRVFHQKFGYGKVLTADGDKLEIAFDKAGVKKVMAGFVMPAEKAG